MPDLETKLDAALNPEQPQAPQKTPPITEFQNEYRWLSNFHPAPVTFQGRTWPTSEHAFQAMKDNSFEYRREVVAAKTPGQAKRLGKKANLRKDWEKVKDDLMYQISKAKYEQNPDLKAKLLATGNAELIEGNDWHDTYWGVCKGAGKNKLGLILMRVREELKNAGETPPL